MYAGRIPQWCAKYEAIFLNDLPLYLKRGSGWTVKVDYAGQNPRQCTKSGGLFLYDLPSCLGRGSTWKYSRFMLVKIHSSVPHVNHFSLIIFPIFGKEDQT